MAAGATHLAQCSIDPKKKIGELKATLESNIQAKIDEDDLDHQVNANFAQFLLLGV